MGLRSPETQTPHLTMAELHQRGFTIIPLGGNDGKKPLITGWTGRRLSLDALQKRMANGKSSTYGVRLDGLLVVDLDTDNELTRQLFRSRFDPSPVTVKTRRGLHHYYEHGGIVPASVRLDNVAIDFKCGSRAFVVGPGSVRPDGQRYEPLDGILGVTPLPPFRDRMLSPDARRIPVGQRNKVLWQRAHEYAGVADNFDGLLADLLALRDIEFDEAASVPDDEIFAVARWAWKLRIEGKIWKGRNSDMNINRTVLDCLLPYEDGTDAYALYSLLQSNHGHEPGKVFAVVPDGIIAAGLWKRSRRQIYRARDTLLEAHLLVLVRKGRLREPNLYRLQSPQVAAALRGQGAGERGLIVTLSASQAHGNRAA